MSAAPEIHSIGSPPDRHAERVVSEITAWLHAERPELHARTIGLLDVSRMGTPVGQERVALRFAKAMPSRQPPAAFSEAPRGHPEQLESARQ
jgi:hypothetical protein